MFRFRLVSTALLAVVMLVGAPALAWPFGGMEGDGHKVVQQRPNLANFKKIEMKGSVDAVIHEGGYQVAVNIDSNLQQLVKTEVRGDTLVIRTEQDLQYRGVGQVEISMPELDGVWIRGSGDVKVSRMSRRVPLELRTDGSGDITYTGAPSAVDLGINGSGDMDLELEQAVDAVSCDIHGSGDVKLEGPSSGSMSITVAGSGDVDARNLPTKSGRFEVNGSGDIKTRLQGGEATFSANGSGDIEWWGEAQVTSERSGGSGEVRHHGA